MRFGVTIQYCRYFSVTVRYQYAPEVYKAERVAESSQPLLVHDITGKNLLIEYRYRTITVETRESTKQNIIEWIICLCRSLGFLSQLRNFPIENLTASCGLLS